MNRIGILTDSHSSISQSEARILGIRVLPMPFYIGDNCYYEDITISRDDFFERLNTEEHMTTSQPSPAEVMDFWDNALKDYDQIIYMPISSGLSNSCSTAMALALEDKYENRVFVVDNGRVSTPLHRSILDALEMVNEGYSAAEIKRMLEEAREEMVIYISVETLAYLKKGGRITAATASLGTLLNIKPILKLDVGKLDSFQKCRGLKKARKIMLDAIRHDLDHRFAEASANGEVYLLAASSASREETEEWIQEIKEAFPGMDILCDNLSLGVSCHTGPGALGIGLSCRPKRLPEAI